jgi:hypothetical protein
VQGRALKLVPVVVLVLVLVVTGPGLVTAGTPSGSPVVEREMSSSSLPGVPGVDPDPRPEPASGVPPSPASDIRTCNNKERRVKYIKFTVIEFLWERIAELFILLLSVNG